MAALSMSLAPGETRRVFLHWSITVPASFSEQFIEEDGYWHAWDEHRSVSLSSIALTDHGRPVPAGQILAVIPPLDGNPVEEIPQGLQGRAAYGPVEPPARASRALAGLIPAKGRVLIVTITSDDFEWARQTWLSIRHNGGPSPSAPRARRRDRRRRRR